MIKKVLSYSKNHGPTVKILSHQKIVSQYCFEPMKIQYIVQSRFLLEPNFHPMTWLLLSSPPSRKEPLILLEAFRKVYSDVCYKADGFYWFLVIISFEVGHQPNFPAQNQYSHGCAGQNIQISWLKVAQLFDDMIKL